MAAEEQEPIFLTWVTCIQVQHEEEQQQGLEQQEMELQDEEQQEMEQLEIEEQEKEQQDEEQQEEERDRHLERYGVIAIMLRYIFALMYNGSTCGETLKLLLVIALNKQVPLHTVIALSFYWLSLFFLCICFPTSLISLSTELEGDFKFFFR